MVQKKLRLLSDKSRFAPNELPTVNRYFNSIRRSAVRSKILQALPFDFYLASYGNTCLVLRTKHNTAIKIGPQSILKDHPFENQLFLKPLRPSRVIGGWRIIESEWLDTSTQSITQEDVNRMILDLYEQYIDFGDAKTSNIGRAADGKVYVIDTGHTEKVWAINEHTATGSVRNSLLEQHPRFLAAKQRFDIELLERKSNVDGTNNQLG